VIKDAPALRSEPYVTSIQDYASKAELQLSAYIDRQSGVPVKVLKDWESVVNELLISPRFGRRVEVSGDVRRTADAAMNHVVPQLDKVKSIYDYVRRTIVWNGTNGLTVYQTPDEVLKTKKGSIADITFLLLSMLNAADIPCYPVVLSTRDNGQIQLVYPIVNQFNYVIAGVTLNGAEIYLDATDPHRPYDVLPFKVIGTQGLIVRQGPVQWATMATKKKYVQSTTAAVSLSAEGKIEGTVDGLADGYAAVNSRDDLDSKSRNEIAEKIFSTKGSGLTIDSTLIEGEESSESPLKFHSRVVGEDYAQSSAGLLYVNPLVVNRWLRTPFATPVRKYPVDMGYGSVISTSIVLTLPKGYQLRELPRDQMITFPNNALSYTQSITPEGNTIHLTARFEVNESEFSPRLYSRVRDFYSQMISAQNIQLVLEQASKKPK
jgi:hypothetical protein